MEGYLGEFPSDKGDKMNATDWALYFIEAYGQIDGAHHKTWVLDQVARVLHGTPVIVTEARWENGTTEMRFRTGEASSKYLDWVRLSKAGEDGPDTVLTSWWLALSRAPMP
jgi:hypothetical protein